MSEDPESGAPTPDASRRSPDGSDPFAEDPRDVEDGGLSIEAHRARTRARMFGGTSDAKTIGRYSILNAVGEGGMGTVYACYDDQLDRRVALKLVKRSERAGARRRMLREAQAMAQLSHPNVVPVFEVGEHEGQLFLAMEFVQGATLQRWRDQTDRDWQEILGKYVQAGRGLAAAHAQGLVHRDFKPHNAVVGSDGRVRVLDFGLAAKDGELASTPSASTHTAQDAVLDASLTETGTVMGTPAYMPPEQIRGRDADARSDQFSFCVALYEALYGQRPYPGTSMSELLEAMEDSALRPAPKGSPVPAKLRVVLVRGLATSQDDRWPSMDALLEQLDTVGSSTGRRWRSVGLVGGLLGVGAILTSALAPPAPDSACPDPAARWEGTWDDATRGAVRGALALESGDEEWRRLETRLDEHVAAWSEVSAENCAARRDGSVDEETLALETLCLETSVSEVATLVELLAESDSLTAETAVAGSDKIASPVRCRGGGTLRQRTRGPRDPELAKVHLLLRVRLSRAAILLGLDRREESEALYATAQAEALEHGFASLAAQGTLGLANAAQSERSRVGGRKTGAAEQLYRNAFTQAQLSGDAVMSARSAVALAVELFNRGKLEEMEHWIQIGEGLLQRVDDPDATIGLAIARAGLLRSRDRLEEAGALFKDAEKIARDNDLRPSIFSCIENRLKVAQSHSQREAIAREGMAWCRETYGPSSRALSTFVMHLIAALANQGRVDDARTEIEQLFGANFEASIGSLDADRSELLSRATHRVGEMTLARDAAVQWRVREQSDGDTAADAASKWLLHLHIDNKDAESARTLLDEIDPTGERRTTDVEISWAAAEVALAEDDPAEALRLMEPFGSTQSDRRIRAKALLALGRPEEAREEFEDLPVEGPHQQAFSKLIEARIHLVLGEPDAVVLGRKACEAIAALAVVDNPDNRDECAGVFRPEGSTRSPAAGL